MEILVSDIAELDAAAGQILEEAGECRVFLLFGAMGSGKTTLVRALCKQLGVQDEVTSPTFSLVNAYAMPGDGQWAYHMDLYRIEHPEELLEIGLEEYLFSGFPCFVEWPELAEGLFPEEVVRLRLEVLPDSSRKIVVL